MLLMYSPDITTFGSRAG